MKPIDTSRLHRLRMDNDARKFEMDDMRPRFEGYRTRHEDGTASRVVVAHQLFQTPPAIASRMVALANPAPGLSWLEPSVGLGRILRPIMATSPASVTVCDESPDCLAEIYREFPTVILAQGDFLERKPTWEGGGGLLVKPFPNAPPFFNRIVMNPPFHMRADIRHTLHALKHLAPGGVLVGLCMATSHRESALRPLADHWETIPAGVFRAEGTNVETYLFRITKPA
jgi:hypothetical protein